MSARSIFLIAAALIVVVVIGQFVVWPFIGFGQDRDMRMVGTGRGVTYNADAFPQFYSNDSRNFYFVTRDGIQFVSHEGLTRWHEIFNFTRPVMVSRGEIVAVGELSGGRSVYVFNANGFMYRVDFEHPVLTFSVNESGFLAVILQYTTGYRIQVYNQSRSSDPLFNQLIIHADQMFPLTAEVSADGRYIATAIMDLSGVLNTFVQFRYISDWDAVGTNQGLFAEDNFPGQVVSRLRFMDDNRLIVATTTQIVCFHVQRSGGISSVREVWRMNLQNALTHLEFYGNRHFAYVTGDRVVGEDNTDPIGTLRIMNINGTQTGYFHLNRRATHLTMGNNAVIVGADRNFHAIDFNGRHLWEYITLHDTRDIIFLDSTDKILVAGANIAEVMERRRFRHEDDWIFD